MTAWLQTISTARTKLGGNSSSVMISVALSEHPPPAPPLYHHSDITRAEVSASVALLVFRTYGSYISATNSTEYKVHLQRSLRPKISFRIIWTTICPRTTDKPRFLTLHHFKKRYVLTSQALWKRHGEWGGKIILSKGQLNVQMFRPDFLHYTPLPLWRRSREAGRRGIVSISVSTSRLKTIHPS